MHRLQPLYPTSYLYTTIPRLVIITAPVTQILTPDHVGSIWEEGEGDGWWGLIGLVGWAACRHDLEMFLPTALAPSLLAPGHNETL